MRLHCSFFWFYPTLQQLQSREASMKSSPHLPLCIRVREANPLPGQFGALWGMAGVGIAPSLQPRGGRSREFICARKSPGLGYKGDVEAVQLQGVSQGRVQSGVWELVQGAQSLGGAP